MNPPLGPTTRIAVALLATAALATGATATASYAATSTTATTAAAPPRLISYAGGESPGVTVHHSAQVTRLKGAPRDFKRFVGRTADRLQRADAGSCDAAAIGVTVDAVRTDGYAVGGISDCGGYAALWARVDGSWREIDGTQDSWECRTLHRYTVPSSIAGDSCYNYRTNKPHAYHQD